MRDLEPYSNAKFNKTVPNPAPGGPNLVTLDAPAQVTSDWVSFEGASSQVKVTFTWELTFAVVTMSSDATVDIQLQVEPGRVGSQRDRLCRKPQHHGGGSFEGTGGSVTATFGVSMSESTSAGTMTEVTTGSTDPVPPYSAHTYWQLVATFQTKDGARRSVRTRSHFIVRQNLDFKDSWPKYKLNGATFPFPHLKNFDQAHTVTLGQSTASIVKTAAMLERLIVNTMIDNHAYFHEPIPKVDWAHPLFDGDGPWQHWQECLHIFSKYEVAAMVPQAGNLVLPSIGVLTGGGLHGTFSHMAERLGGLAQVFEYYVTGRAPGLNNWHWGWFPITVDNSDPKKYGNEIARGIAVIQSGGSPVVPQPATGKTLAECEKEVSLKHEGTWRAAPGDGRQNRIPGGVLHSSTTRGTSHTDTSKFATHIGASVKISNDMKTPFFSVTAEVQASMSRDSSHTVSIRSSASQSTTFKATLKQPPQGYNDLGWSELVQLDLLHTDTANDASIANAAILLMQLDQSGNPSSDSPAVG